MTLPILATSEPEQLGAHFDWYAATINVGVDDLRAILCDTLGGTAEPRDGAKNGYHHREVILSAAGDVLATILHGGNGGLPHAFASGDHAPAFVDLVRGRWAGRHRVSRMDVALDFDNGDGTFLDLLSLCHGIADGERVEGDERKRAAKVSTGQMGDWHHARRGRTFYLGSFKSPVLVRLYEKGIQLREDAAKRGRPRTDISDNLVRLEVQVRPDKAAKERASSATPEEAFGYAEWSRELLRRVNGAEVERVDIRERRLPDHERAMQWLVKQYEKHLLLEVAEVGGWENLGVALRRRMETGQGPVSVFDPESDVPF